MLENIEGKYNRHRRVLFPDLSGFRRRLGQAGWTCEVSSPKRATIPRVTRRDGELGKPVAMREGWHPPSGGYPWNRPVLRHGGLR